MSRSKAHSSHFGGGGTINTRRDMGASWTKLSPSSSPRNGLVEGQVTKLG